MKKLYVTIILLFVFSIGSSQELMNYYVEPINEEEITITTLVHRNALSLFGGYNVDFIDNNITLKLCYINTSYQSGTLDRQDIVVLLPNGYNSYNIHIELYGDNDDFPCTYDNLVSLGSINLEYPYNPTETTSIPDNSFENFIEDFGFGDDIPNNDLVFTHRIVNMTKLLIDNIYPDPLIQSMEGLQDFISLKELRCSNNLISNLDVSNNINLQRLSCSDNPINELDLANNVNLIWLSCSSTNLTTLDTSNNSILTRLGCSNSLLKTINVTQNQYLNSLSISLNQLENIDVSNNFLLENLYCSNNLLSTLNVSNNTTLTKLSFDDNTITEIDLSNNIFLEELSCSNNFLTSLNTSMLTNLSSITFNENLITELDFSNNTYLQSVFIINNSELITLNLKNGNNTFLTTLFVINNSNLFCVDVDDPNQAPYPGWTILPEVTYSDNCSLGINDDLLKEITIYPNPVKNILMVKNESNFEINSIKIFNELGSLVLEQNIPLIQIDVSKFSRGLYFMQIETENGILTKKIIKE